MRLSCFLDPGIDDGTLDHQLSISHERTDVRRVGPQLWRNRLLHLDRLLRDIDPFTVKYDLDTTGTSIVRAVNGWPAFPGVAVAPALPKK